MIKAINDQLIVSPVSMCSGIAAFSVLPLPLHDTLPRTIREAVKQRTPIDAGFMCTTIRVTPSKKLVVLVARGNDADSAKPEDPGALKNSPSSQ